MSDFAYNLTFVKTHNVSEERTLYLQAKTRGLVTSVKTVELTVCHLNTSDLGDTIKAAGNKFLKTAIHRGVVSFDAYKPWFENDTPRCPISYRILIDSDATTPNFVYLTGTNITVDTNNATLLPNVGLKNTTFIVQAYNQADNLTVNVSTAIEICGFENITNYFYYDLYEMVRWYEQYDPNST